jgi:hypothetical protein
LHNGHCFKIINSTLCNHSRAGSRCRASSQRVRDSCVKGSGRGRHINRRCEFTTSPYIASSKLTARSNWQHSSHPPEEALRPNWMQHPRQVRIPKPGRQRERSGRFIRRQRR